MSNKGAQRKITRWSQFIIGLSTLPKRALKDVGDEILRDIDSNYSAERDPYGKRWAKRKGQYGWKILDRTGHMRRSYVLKVRGEELDVKNTAPYSRFHQLGTKNLKVRAVLPTERRGLPESWRLLIVKALRRHWKSDKP